MTKEVPSPAYAPPSSTPGKMRLPIFKGPLILAAAALLLAAGLKAYHLATGPIASTGLSSRWLLIVQVEFEIFLGLWLLSGLLKRAAWLTTCACFAVFIAVNLYKGATGEVSCGCMGRLSVSPWAMLAIDAVLLSLLLVFRPSVAGREPIWRPRLRLGLGLGLALAAGIPSAILMASYTPAVLSGTGQVAGTDRYVLLEPNQWIGKPFPLAAYIDIAPKITAGKWTVVLYRHDCPSCLEAIPKFERQAKDSAVGGRKANVALVEMPPYASNEKALVHQAKDSPCLLGKLRQPADKRDWFAEGPVVLVLMDGVVVKAQEGSDGGKADLTQVARSVPLPPGSPVVQADANGGSCDLGFVEPKSVHYVTFSIANSSDQPLAIKGARSDCECMTLSSVPAAIPPRGSAAVEVRLESPKENTKYSGRVLLETADPSRKRIVLLVQADVGVALAVKPNMAEVGKVLAGTPKRIPLVISNRGKQAVHPVYATSSTPGCIIEVPRAEIPPGGELSLPLVVKAAAGAAGPQKATVTIHTDSVSQPSLDVQVRYEVSKDQG